MVSFLLQTCDILRTEHPDLDDLETRSLGSAKVDDNVSDNVIVVANLSCRIDPVRFRSREQWQDSRHAMARELEYHTMIYTAWTDVNITNDMRLRVNDPHGEIYNIISVNRVTDNFGLGHHLEIECMKGFNV